VKTEQYKCDNCGAVKGETNRWWRVYVTTVVGGPGAILVQAFDIRRPMYVFPEETKAYDLCGQGCVAKRLSEFMEQAQ